MFREGKPVADLIHGESATQEVIRARTLKAAA